MMMMMMMIIIIIIIIIIIFESIDIAMHNSGHKSFIPIFDH